MSPSGRKSLNDCKSNSTSRFWTRRAHVSVPIQVPEYGIHERAVRAARRVAAWALAVLIFAAAGGLALLIRWRLVDATPELRGWRAWLIWGPQSALVALVLLLLWQPAMMVSELNSQQNIIAVVVDDSRSMGIADSDGKTREAAALAALSDGVLAGLQKRFQTRVYRLGRELTRVDGRRGLRRWKRPQILATG